MEKLLEMLFRAHYRDIYGYLYAMSRDASLAEELAAETFLEAVKSVASFRGRSDVKTWLFSLARHRWFGYLRRKGRMPETEVLSDLLADHRRTPEARLLDRELAEAVKRYLREESERTQKVVRLRMEGLSYYEIGQKLGITENSARVIHFRVREKLKSRLIKEGLLDG